MSLTEEELNQPFNFAELMRFKLQKNEHKGPWTQYGLDCLREGLLEEVAELLDAIDNDEHSVDVALEAADVANFAMMVADVYERERKKMKKRHEAVE